VKVFNWRAGWEIGEWESKSQEFGEAWEGEP
jgi:hypothetical protein